MKKQKIRKRKKRNKGGGGVVKSMEINKDKCGKRREKQKRLGKQWVYFKGFTINGNWKVEVALSGTCPY